MQDFVAAEAVVAAVDCVAADVIKWTNDMICRLEAAGGEERTVGYT